MTSEDLKRIGEKARKNPKERFTSIYHQLYDEEYLKYCCAVLKRGKAPGVDGETVEEYSQELSERVEDLAERLARQGYRPQPVRRSYIAKPGSQKKRPLGIPAVEDKLVQMALTQILNEIYEADFLDCSYGYRPGRSCHDALDQLGRILQQKWINYVVEADIKGFFDHVNHDWLKRMLEVRIGDQRVVRLIERFLKAGVMEDGLVKASEEGTPQGGVLSPLLSNIYLHYGLDLWFEKVFRRSCRGEAYFFRYADDYLACFQYQQDAQRFLKEMKARLEKFHLEVATDKTKRLAFGRFAAENARRRGQEPEEFDFLGFTHYCGKTRYGCFKVKRRTSSKKFRAKLKEVKSWLVESRDRMKAGEILQRAKSRLEGHLNYYAITDNSAACQSFSSQMARLLFKWLNRRSQKKSYNWEQFNSALAWVDWPKNRIRKKLDPFRPLAVPNAS